MGFNSAFKGLTFRGVRQRLGSFCSRRRECNKANRVFEAKMHSTLFSKWTVMATWW